MIGSNVTPVKPTIAAPTNSFSVTPNKGECRFTNLSVSLFHAICFLCWRIKWPEIWYAATHHTVSANHPNWLRHRRQMYPQTFIRYLVVGTPVCRRYSIVQLANWKATFAGKCWWHHVLLSDRRKPFGQSNEQLNYIWHIDGSVAP